MIEFSGKIRVTERVDLISSWPVETEEVTRSSWSVKTRQLVLTKFLLKPNLRRLIMVHQFRMKLVRNWLT